MIPNDVLSGMRSRFALYSFPTLRAATFEETARHLRVDFYFSGGSEDVDFDELESGLLSELIADCWAGFDSIGFAVVFDETTTMLR